MEYFMEKDLYFNYIIGVSAGACNAVSYISRQKGRNEKVIINFVRNWRYMSLRSYLLTKSFFGMDFIFDEIPNKHVPFDFDTFNKSKCRFVVGTTDCKTGKPVYFAKEDIKDKFHVLRATASLPLVSPIVKYNGYELLDGGVSDSIPILKSIEDGNKKNIIVLTRNKGYRKSPQKLTGLIKLKYRKYPQLVETLLNRYSSYNETMDLIDKLEEEGKALIIRPSKKLAVDRMEKDTQKLKELLQNGYDDAKDIHEKISQFISG
jgi:predicted patatin/cPLA2 family phospholipase